ncbi:ribosome assembly cofactor RimP [Oceanispirochaeta crateris]|uniref:ribosome assembly cofactor RimP n=1 Tax=Oceanispirochaeta crateris TaxID=2518645 RepID=UPI00143CDA4D|nr:ribosome assembly cofactor RimP [Oceanispirochaeta crateris]
MKDIDSRIIEDLEPVLKAMGIALVECNVAIVKQVYNIRLVIFRAEGISLKDCEDVHKIIKPRLDLLIDSRDLSLEITSPGIDRRIKSSREYDIFKGKFVKILLESSNDWISGKIVESDGVTLVLIIDDKKVSYSLDQVRKGKLDYTMEAR